MVDIVNDLNKEQLAAVTATEGHIRLIAGAGTGKTRVLTYRYAYLIEQLGIMPSNIMCITFTNKAAAEMKKRINAMVGDNLSEYISTFHGFCVIFLREHIHAVSFPSNFVILDENDTKDILKRVYETIKISTRDYKLKDALAYINSEKAKGEYLSTLLTEDTAALKNAYFNDPIILRRIFYGYIYEQRKCFGLDFEDLITLTLHILENIKTIREKWQKRLMYIMVDEFQDVNGNQYKLAKILSAYHQNLFVVGDPDQTIYTWRGAKVEYILGFDKEYKDAQTLYLTLNYRSTPNIINASDSLIEKNRNRLKKTLTAVSTEDISVLYNHTRNDEEEAKWVVRNINKLVAQGVKFKEIAVLYRSHYVSRGLEEFLVRENIRYVLFNGVEFYKRKEIKDVIAYLRLIAFGDDISFTRVINEPRRGFGKKKMELLKELAQKSSDTLYNTLLNCGDDTFDKPQIRSFVGMIEEYRKIYRTCDLMQLLEGVMNDSGYEQAIRNSGDEDRLNNLAELKQSAANMQKEENLNLEAYLDKISLFVNNDMSGETDAVKMMTIHSSKGLEFPYVFVCQLNEGVFPSRHADRSDSVEEERRLAYVALTRAQKRLFLSSSEGVTYDGCRKYPSRFINDIDEKYLEFVTKINPEMKCFASYNNGQGTGWKAINFRQGDIVTHPVWGEGRIESVDFKAGCYNIKFERFETIRSVSMRINLEKIKQ